MTVKTAPYDANCCACRGTCMHVGPHSLCDMHRGEPQNNNLGGYMSGWTCPRCGRGNSPFTATCPCIPMPLNITCGDVK